MTTAHETVTDIAKNIIESGVLVGCPKDIRRKGLVPYGINSRHVWSEVVRIREEQRAEAHAQWRRDNPEIAAKHDAEREARRAAWAEEFRVEQAKRDAEAAASEIRRRRAARLRRVAQAGLRKLGYVRQTTTDSGSCYYINRETFDRIRISDHDVPMTMERLESNWSWATHGRTVKIDVDTQTVRSVRRQLAEISQ